MKSHHPFPQEGNYPDHGLKLLWGMISSINAGNGLTVFTSSKSVYNDKLGIWPDHAIDSLNPINSSGLTITYTPYTRPWTVITVAR